MKLCLQAAAVAFILTGCAAIETVGDRFPSTSSQSSTQRAPAPNSDINAVSRPQAPQQTTEQMPQTQEAPISGTGQIDDSIDPATARSYNAQWEQGGYRHRSVMFPHIIDGCKVMIQSRRTLDYVGGSEGEFYEFEGPDCNCDLVIDGYEDVFAQLNDSYKTPRMYDVCAGPGVNGNTRQLEIMRESLKEQRNFDKMGNVEGF